MPRRSAAGAVALGLTVVALVLVGVAAWTLADNQADQRRDLRDRFVDRTAVASSLVDSLFQVAFTSQTRDAGERLGGRVTAADLDAQVKRSQAVYAAVADPSGRLIAASKGTPPDTAARLAAHPFHVRRALRNGFGLADARDGAIESAIAFQTPQGPRVLLQATPLKTYSSFLAGTLRPLPTLKGSEAVVLDGHGRPVGGLTHLRKPPVVTRGLVEAGLHGTYTAEGGKVFVGAAPLPATRWRIAVTAPEDELYASVRGLGQWVPWVLLGVGTLALLAVGLLLWRLAGTTRMLRQSNAELDASRRVLEERARELERSNEDLEQFAYAASHDLSEPLRTVAGFSALLQSRYAGRLDPAADEYIGHMATGVDRMQQLIDDLLKYSRVGRAPLREDDVDLEEVLDEVTDWTAPAVRERGAVITHDPLPVVRGERGQLAQVLQNLVSNAVKFTAPGASPEVHVSAAPEGRDGWRISVRDNGIGIDGGEEHLFKMFGRLNPADRYPGTGIGLALAKRIIEGHGGRIWAEAAPGGGSIFSFTVPAAAGVQAAARS